MNLKSIINGLAVLLPMALASQGATPTILDWQFNTGANPTAPEPAGANSDTVNNTGGTASQSIAGDIANYYFNGRPGYSGTGNERGMWDTLNGQFTLTIQAGTTSPGESLDYTLRIDQFWDGTDQNPSGGFFPALVKFSIGAPATSTRTILDSTPSLGQWVEDTFTWHVTPSQMYTPLSLTITPDTSTGGTGELFFDRVRWDIVGDIAVPEPHAQALAALGLLAFGVRSWFRRKD